MLTAAMRADCTQVTVLKSLGAGEIAVPKAQARSEIPWSNVKMCNLCHVATEFMVAVGGNNNNNNNNNSNNHNFWWLVFCNWCGCSCGCCRGCHANSWFPCERWLQLMIWLLSHLWLVGSEKVTLQQWLWPVNIVAGHAVHHIARTQSQNRIDIWDVFCCYSIGKHLKILILLHELGCQKTRYENMKDTFVKQEVPDWKRKIAEVTWCSGGVWLVLHTGQPVFDPADFCLGRCSCGCPIEMSNVAMLPTQFLNQRVFLSTWFLEMVGGLIWIVREYVFNKTFTGGSIKWLFMPVEAITGTL